ncbi:hypothetical protein BpHYR1_053545 [Brachionus plicatilis]|uniref:Uncharacterized protein n=1 Tax=Brachionus plicatilis TaxID=10195 RepID=A0A3M7PJS1_BRAPC|nr:hypothetical protein BpHYR1_053545 [Brachionus plicatilis]
MISKRGLRYNSVSEILSFKYNIFLKVFNFRYQKTYSWNLLWFNRWPLVSADSQRKINQANSLIQFPSLIIK